ncbi:18791_t:CDS:2, partial [Gigaspora margarita]
PTNTGYSYSDEVVTTSVATNDVYAFLQLFLHQFPNNTHLDFHIAAMINPYMDHTNRSRSIFDIRRKCDEKIYCYSEADDIVIFSNLENIKTELGVNSSLVFKACNKELFNKFALAGVEVWVKELKWSGTKSFNNTNVTRWITKDTAKHAGGVRTFEGLTFLRIFKAGHMVPVWYLMTSQDPV